MRIGFSRNSIVDHKAVHTIWDNSGNIIFEGKASIGVGAKLVVHGTLKCGDNFAINGDTSIIVNKNIVFGNDCLLSWGSLIMDTDFHPVYDFSNNRMNEDKEIKIGNHCWIGCNVLIKKGTVLPDGAIVAAGSVVSKEIDEPNSIIVNNSMLKKDCYWRMD